MPFQIRGLTLEQRRGGLADRRPGRQIRLLRGLPILRNAVPVRRSSVAALGHGCADAAKPATGLGRSVKPPQQRPATRFSLDSVAYHGVAMHGPEFAGTLLIAAKLEVIPPGAL